MVPSPRDNRYNTIPSNPLRAVLSVLFAGLALASGSIRAGLRLHSLLLANVLRQPMLWFDTTPTGRILARFASDMNTVDVALPNSFKQILYDVMRVRHEGLIKLCVCVRCKL